MGLWDREDTLAVPRPLETQFAYDRVGNVRTGTDARGRTSERRYDAAGRLYEALDPLGNRQVFSFDPASNVAAATQHDLAASGPIATTFGYDALGREVLSTDARGNKVQSAYDARHQLVQVIDQENHFTTFGYDGLGRQVPYRTSYERDERGNVTEVTAPGNVVTRSRYNQLDWLLEECRDATGQNACTRYHYDKAGRPVRIEKPFGAGQHLATKMEYGPREADRVNRGSTLAR